MKGTVDMKKLIGLAAVLAALYAAYWVVGSRTALNGARDLITIARNAGWGDAEDVTLRGFPSRFDLTFSQPQLDSADGFLSWTTPRAQVFALSYQPNQAIIFLPDEQALRMGDQTFTLSSKDTRASIETGFSTSLPLQEAVAVIKSPVLTPEGQPKQAIRADQLRLAVAAQSPDTALLSAQATGGVAAAPAAAYRIGTELTDLVAPQAMAHYLPKGLPLTIERLHLDAIAGLSAPLDKAATLVPPVLDTLQVRDLTMSWGGKALSAEGAIAIAADGRPSGTLTLRSVDWKAWLDLLVEAGLLPQKQKPMITMLAGQMAAKTPDQALELKVVFKDGQMRIAGLPVGPAPVLR
ncbi:hypothetical protein BFP70_08390 [Thioclava sp. SK-1]|uniref:DUF2125 domain-containing protein n=1 Tax=Thioclava sp. SK-1 TaxID=1889770 RepID=UPI000855D4E5|nr:DUF2125 domain-containing protein [Thioclava sp. SK-1]OCX66118.1 hypothetical protein BFP70_08390 [Thioclava sp. SK-1]